jgi:hypothetical protein
MADARAQDAYDVQHFGFARTAGQVAGTGAQLVALGPLDELVVGSRIAQATPMIAREAGVLAGAGGASGVATQAASDLASHKLSSLGDYAASGVGGAVDTLASARFGAGTGGAAGGATTSIARDLFNGRPISIGDAAESAASGADLAIPTALGGRIYSNGLSRTEKGRLGERLSTVRTRARFDSTLPGAKTRYYLDDGGWTVPDSRTVGGDIVESKFGLRSDLSKRQGQAYRQPVPGYRVDQFHPHDIGVAFGVPVGLLSGQVSHGLVSEPGGPSPVRPGLLGIPAEAMSRARLSLN